MKWNKLLTERERQAEVCKINALGLPGEDYPVTLARFHKNLRIVSDRNTLAKPKYNI